MFTVRAGKRRLAGMSQFVCLQVTGLGERLDTSIAEEVFISSMGSFMQLQMIKSGESFVTDCAFKRLLPGVSAAVDLQPTWSLEDFRAYLTVLVHGPQWFRRYWLVCGSACHNLNVKTKKWIN